jgi:hypothetical protein
MANDFEYYVITRENNNNYPLIITDSDCPPYEDEEEAIENPQRMYFCLGKPIPKKPIMVDFHSQPKSVISDKIYTVLNNLNIKGIQLIPATIRSKDNEYSNYWYIHIINRFPALDREKSIFQWNDIIEEAWAIEKLVLDEKVLKSIPLNERLVFYLVENSAEQFFHKSVVDIIMAVDPIGLKFVKIEDYSF